MHNARERRTTHPGTHSSVLEFVLALGQRWREPGGGAMRERSAVRVIPSYPVTVAIEEGGLPVAYGVVANISETGACLLTDADLGIGQEHLVKLSFPRESELLEARVRIVWGQRREGQAGSLRYGLEFYQTPEVRARLKTLISPGGSP